jgi:hypothetical protein
MEPSFKTDLCERAGKDFTKELQQEDCKIVGKYKNVETLISLEI